MGELPTGWRKDRRDPRDYYLYTERLRSLLSQVQVVRAVDKLLDRVEQFTNSLESNLITKPIASNDGYKEFRTDLKVLRENIGNIMIDVVTQMSLIDIPFETISTSTNSLFQKNIVSPISPEVIEAITSVLGIDEDQIEEENNKLKIEGLSRKMAPVGQSLYEGINAQDTIEERRKKERDNLKKLAEEANQIQDYWDELKGSTIKLPANVFSSSEAEEIPANATNQEKRLVLPLTRELTQSLVELESRAAKERNKNRNGFLSLFHDINRPENTNQEDTYPYLLLPSAVDLTYWCPPIEDQQEWNTCTAHAVAALIGHFERKSSGEHTPVSRKFIYQVTCKLWRLYSQADPNQTGPNPFASIRQTLRAIELFGSLPEENWPYKFDNSQIEKDSEPDTFCYSYAQNNRGIQYFRLDRPKQDSEETQGVLDEELQEVLLLQIKTVLSAGFPCVFGFLIHPSIEEDLQRTLTSTEGLIRFPTLTDQDADQALKDLRKQRQGHALLAVGYDDDKMIEDDQGALLVRNSWGSGWGNKGYGWLPYKYVLQGLAVDWWSMMKPEWISAGEFGLTDKLLGKPKPNDRPRPRPRNH